jgi:L-histidine N-alpha-methyltransferase
MTTKLERFTIERLSEPADFEALLRRDVREGLTATPKTLPSIYFYDDHGSDLFDQITELPEYYLTRLEAEILEEHADKLISRFCPHELMEIGAGFARKTRILLSAMHRAGVGDAYVPIDVSDAALEHAGAALTDAYEWLTVRAYVGDFGTDLHRVPSSGNRIVAFLGSTLGNLAPVDRPAFLAEIAASVADEDVFLLGVDLVKDEATMVAAYDDSQGISAAFNKNILSVINRTLGGDLPLDAFDHETAFFPGSGCMKQGLRANRDVTTTLTDVGLTIEFARGELIHTEWSCKFTIDGITAELAQAGLTVTDALTDRNDHFALIVATKR